MNLIIIGRSFVLAYILAVLSTFFPIRFSDLGWQQQVLDTIINAGSVPITGRVFIVVALLYKGYDSSRLTAEPDFDRSDLPISGFLSKRKIARILMMLKKAAFACKRLFIVFGPSIFFAVIAILQLAVSTRTFRALDAASLNQVSALTQQITQARASLSGSSDSATVEQAIRLLVPTSEQPAIAALSPQQQRSQLIERLNNRENTLRLELGRQRTQRSTAIIWQTIKNVLIAMLYGYCLYFLRPAAVRNLLKGAI